MKSDVRVLLHNIRSAHNVGAIFRTADALGVNMIYLSGYTPSPLDRFGRPVKEIAKTALGAELAIPWEYHKTPQKLIAQLKKESMSIVGIEQDKHSIDYKEFIPKDPTLFLVGNEVRGISLGLRKKCDALIHIPMRGKKESLNVSVAFGVALFRMLGQ
jgi:tRNA G18 (ribose-2'-O)-methylase SpoU